MPISWLDFTSYLPAATIPSYPSLDPWTVAGPWSLAADGLGITVLKNTTCTYANKLLRPATENRLNCVTKFVYFGNGSSAEVFTAAIHRLVGTAAYLPGVYNGGALLQYTADGMNIGQIGAGTVAWTTPVDFAHPIEYTLETYQDSSGDTVCSAGYLDLTSGYTETKSLTDTGNLAPQVAGRFGFVGLDPGSGGVLRVRRLSHYDRDATADAAPSFVLNVATTAANADIIPITVTGTATNWKAGVLFTISGGSARIESVAVNSETSISMFVRPGLATATVTISDLFGKSASFSVTGTATGLMPGLLEITAQTNSQISLSCSAATGGTGPYTYELQRDTSPLFSSPTVIGTGLTATDSSLPADGTAFFYRTKVTDSAGTPLVAYSRGKLRTGFGLISNKVLPAVSLHDPIGVGCLGDSITAGTSVGLSPTVRFSYHMNRGARVFTVLNRGIPASTSTLWRSDNASNYLDSAIAAIEALGTSEKWATILLGANDASIEGNSAATFLDNITEMTNFLTAAGINVLIFPPPLALSITDGDTLADRLISYGAIVAPLENGTDVFVADNKTRDEFILRPSELGDGVHPNDDGGNAQGEITGGEFDRIIYAVIAAQGRRVRRRATVMGA
jgi:lysophospholipase L1-like esterase